MKVSICIACHNQAQFLREAVMSCLKQDYKDLEVVVLDDASTDNPRSIGLFTFPMVKYFRSDEPSGSGEAFNKSISHATGDIIVLLCADDLFTDHRVISDIVDIFNKYSNVIHVTRYYHQFIDGDRHPVRAWRGNNVIELANNPSGLAFRKEYLNGCKLSNKMFVEAPSLVACIKESQYPFWYSIMEYDTVAVRIHKSTARSHTYYRKMWTSSPVEEWAKLGWRSNDFTSLIQIKNYFTTRAVIKESWNFVRVSPMCLLNPAWWIFSCIAILTPRFILNKVPEIYRYTWGRWTTREVKRKCD